VLGTYTDIDQDFEAARSKAMQCGASGFFLEDLKREFVEELIYRELAQFIRYIANTRPSGCSV